MDIVQFLFGLIIAVTFVKFRHYFLPWYRLLAFMFNNHFRDGVNQSALLEHVRKNAKQGDAESVIRVLDKYTNEISWSWQLGDVKGKILDDAVTEVNPKYALELGSYCGYSTVRIARLLKEGSRLLSIELNPISAKTAREVVDFAGLSSKVTIINGSTTDVIPSLKTDYGIHELNIVFIDHFKDLYLTDLKQLEEAGLIQIGTTLVADNMKMPGAPEYAKYLQDSENYSNTIYHSHVEGGLPLKDDVWKSIRLS